MICEMTAAHVVSSEMYTVLHQTFTHVVSRTFVPFPPTDTCPSGLPGNATVCAGAYHTYRPRRKELANASYSPSTGIETRRGDERWVWRRVGEKESQGEGEGERRRGVFDILPWAQNSASPEREVSHVHPE
jgi:hypothetical protein